MRYRKCPNCGAPIERDKTICSYCGTDAESGVSYRSTSSADVPIAPPIVPGKTHRVEQSVENPAVAAAGVGRVVVFVLMLFMCSPGAVIYMWTSLLWRRRSKWIITAVVLTPWILFLIFGLFSETSYAIKSESAKFSPESFALDNRQHENISHDVVFQNIRLEGGRERDEVRKTWSDQYADRWVRWKLRVTQKNIYTTMASELRLKPEQGVYEVEVFFDPAKNEELEHLAVGEEVTVSGRLWGYYLMTDRIRLADGLILPE